MLGHSYPRLRQQRQAQGCRQSLCRLHQRPIRVSDFSKRVSPRDIINTDEKSYSMKAWGATLDPTSKTDVCTSHPRSIIHPPTHFRLLKTQIRFLGDPSGQFNKDLDLTFESAAVFGQDRSKRYALVVEDGKVKSAHVEPDNTGVNGKGFIKKGYSSSQI